MQSTLIKDTTKSERIQLIKQWEETDGCEDCGFDIWSFYKEYIDGTKEIAQIHAEFRTPYISDILEEV